MTKYVKKFMDTSTKQLVNNNTHEQLDKLAKDFLGNRPYKLGATKPEKIEAIKKVLECQEN